MYCTFKNGISTHSQIQAGEIQQGLDVLNSSQKKPPSIIILIHPRLKHSGIVSQPLQCWDTQGFPGAGIQESQNSSLDGILWNAIKMRTRQQSRGKAEG